MKMIFTLLHSLTLMNAVYPWESSFARISSKMPPIILNCVFGRILANMYILLNCNYALFEPILDAVSCGVQLTISLYSRLRDAEDVWFLSTEASETFLSLKAGSDSQSLICQRTFSERRYLTRWPAWINITCSAWALFHDPAAVVYLQSLILLSLWIVFIVTFASLSSS